MLGTSTTSADWRARRAAGELVVDDGIVAGWMQEEVSGVEQVAMSGGEDRGGRFLYALAANEAAVTCEGGWEVNADGDEIDEWGNGLVTSAGAMAYGGQRLTGNGRCLGNWAGSGNKVARSRRR